MRKSPFLEIPPKTLGDHLRRCRTARNLSQGEAARLLGTKSETVLHWEKGHTEPSIEAYPAILEFLGYAPFPQPDQGTLQGRMLAFRRSKGWPVKVAAKRFRVDRKTWKAWEQGVAPTAKRLGRLEKFLGS